MTEVLFYHLEHTSLEHVLPGLLEKSMERGWRAVVQAGSAERIEALNMHLWTYREDSFLPHGSAKDGNITQQPIFLTSSDDNPNTAQIRFLVDGAHISSQEAMAIYERVVYIFDGQDPEALVSAREQWKILKTAGYDLTYWQQNPQGRWEKKA